MNECIHSLVDKVVTVSWEFLIGFEALNPLTKRSEPEVRVTGQLAEKESCLFFF